MSAHLFRQLCPLSAVAICLLAGALCLAADAPLQVQEAAIGFAGKYKAGHWQPIHLRLAAGPQGAKGQLEVVVADGDQVPVVHTDAQRGTIDLAPGQEHSVLLYAKSGPVNAGVTVRLMAGEHVAWSQSLALSTPLPSTSELIVSLGPSLGLEQAADVLRRRADAAGIVHIQSPDTLPDRWWGYRGVDCLLLATSDPAFLSAMTAEQKEAIVQWVLLGGRIVLCVGAQGAEIAATTSSFLPLIPGEFVEVEPLRDRAGLENFTKTELPFNDPFFQRNRPLVTRLKNVRGEVLLDEQGSSSGRPLVVRSPAGLGLVNWIGIDLDHPALKDWKGRTRLLAPVVARPDAEHDQDEREAHRGVAHLGYLDLIGQLRSALDRFGGVKVVNFTTVAMMVVGYLLLIGPGDYFFLSRLGLPRHLTWFTFPAVTIAAAVLAIAVDRQTHGNRPRLNQAEIIDIDVSRQVARGTVWAHVYSPATRQAAAQLDVNNSTVARDDQLQGWLTWQGLPGASLGGLESRQPPLVNRNPYRSATPGGRPTLSDLVIPLASAKSLSACWWSKANVQAGNSLFLDRYGLLAGEFIQPLGAPLDECLLAHGEKLYRIPGSLAPGDRVKMADLPPLNLESRLTQSRVELSKDVSTPWDKASTDVPRIMQMVMFHEAARGRSYTGLTHRYQPQIDLSEHVRLGQAVLVGRAKEPVAKLVDPGTGSPLVDPASSNTWTWYRIVLPVNPK
jgi:hypothetical protein